MRIAIVTDYHNKTGIGKQNYQLYRALLDGGHDVTIVHLVSKQGFSATPEYGVNVESASFVRGVFWDFRKGLLAELRKNRYDVVLLGHQGLAYLRSAVRKAGVPSVLIAFDFFTLYPQYSNPWDPRFFVFNHFLLGESRKFDNVVFSSKFTERDFERFFGALPKFSTVIPVGIPQNDDDGQPSGKDWPQSFGGKRIVLQVGSSDARKNSSTYFAIAESALSMKGFENVAFVRVGKTPQARKDAAPPNMFFLQNLSESDLVSLYGVASVFVFTSWHEGYWMPVAEARANGLPVVSTKISDMSEIFAQDPGVRFVDDPNEPKGYLDAVEAFLRDGERKIPSPTTDSLSTAREAEKYVSFFRQIIANS